MPESPAPLIADRVLHGRYRLVRPIARGGMAEVWEGKDEVLARAVAIKVLHRHLSSDPGFRERFRREAIAAARLAHPNVVATFDAATGDDEAYIVMELVRGRSLRRALSEDGPMDPERAVTVALQVAAALAHAHGQGLIHRDVKPGNILLCEDSDGWVQAKVADFGIAKAAAGAGGDLTQTGGIVGTAKYLSPEQVEGHEPDARSDIYALGVTLYEMLCGQPPFSADTELATALAHVRTDPVPPRRRRPGIPRPLETAVLHAMARDRADRPQTVAAFRAELAAVDLGPDDATSLLSPDPTPPDPLVPSAQEPSRRRSVAPLVALAIVVVAAAVLGGVLLSVRDRHGRTGQPAAAGTRATAAISITGATAYDPLGDGHEHDEETRLAIDGNPATAWHTQVYNGRRFGGLKDGVGLVLELQGQPKLHQLKITTPTKGWSAKVYIAGSPGPALSDWGQEVATLQAIDGDATFDLGSRTGGAVLLWITDPGGNQAQVNEASLS